MRILRYLDQWRIFYSKSTIYVSAALNQVDVGDEYDTGYAFEVGYLPVDGLLLAVEAANENVDPVQIPNYGYYYYKSFKRCNSGTKILRCLYIPNM